MWIWLDHWLKWPLTAVFPRKSSHSCSQWVNFWMKIEWLILRQVNRVKKGNLKFELFDFHPLAQYTDLTAKSLNPSIYYCLQWLRHFLAVVNLPHAWILMMIMWNFTWQPVFFFITWKEFQWLTLIGYVCWFFI